MTGDPFDFNNAPPLRLIDTADHEKRLEKLRSALEHAAPELVRDIFPRARIQGTEARVGSTDGEPGESLSITLAGDRAGLWYDHATGQGGDLIDLWQQTRGHADFLAAVDDLESWCGLSTVKKPRAFTAIGQLAKQRAKAAPPLEQQPAGLGAPSGQWHYLNKDGVVLGIVRRYETPNGKTFRQWNGKGEAKAPDPRPLYRIPHIADAQTVVLVEGEKKADALASIGIEATTAMGGANAPPEKTDWSPLAGKTILNWPDNDEPGLARLAMVRPHLEAIGCTVLDVPLPAGKPAKWDAADAVAEGADVGAILAGASPGPAPVANPRALRFLSIEDLASLKPPEWLVDGIVPHGGFVSVYGQHGSLKSFLALDWALCAAYGRPWLGKYPVKAGPVVYIAGEGQAGLAARILGWRTSKGEAGRAPLHIVPQAVAVSTSAIAELLALIASLAAPPVLVVLDTLARTFGPGDENSQKDMNAYIAGVDRIRVDTGAAVLVVHHTGKDEGRGSRGSTALPGAVDTNIMVKREGRSVTLKNKAPHGKQKDAEEFDDIRLGFSKIEFEHQGTRASTLVLTLDESPIADDSDAPPARSAGPQGSNQAAVIKALRAAKGDALGMTRLAAMTRLDNSKVAQAVKPLVAKGLVLETEDGGARRWLLA